MGLIAGSTLLIHAVRLLNDLSKKDRAKGYVIISRDRGRLRTRYRIDCSKTLPSSAEAAGDEKARDSKGEPFLSVQVNNPPFVAQKLLERYANGSKLGEWFGLNKKRLQDLEEIKVMIYAASG